MFIDVVSANTIASLLRGEIDEREREASVDLTSFACRLCSFLCYKLSGSSPRCRNPEGQRYVCFVEHRCFFGFEGLFARLCTPTLFRVVREIFGREERERENRFGKLINFQEVIAWKKFVKNWKCREKRLE